MLGTFKKHMAVFKNTKKCEAQKTHSNILSASQYGKHEINRNQASN